MWVGVARKRLPSPATDPSWPDRATDPPEQRSEACLALRRQRYRPLRFDVVVATVFQPRVFRCNCTSLAALFGVTLPEMRDPRLAVTDVLIHCDCVGLAAFQNPGASKRTGNGTTSADPAP